MSKNEPEYELDFVRYQEVSLKRVSMKNDKPLGSKSDRKFMEKAAKNETKRFGGKRGH